MDCRSTIAGLLCLGVAHLASAAAVDVTSCPARVPAGAVGVVQGDLDCTDTSGFAYLVLERGAALDLNGHTVTFNPGPVVSALVHCESSCRILGPGSLTSAAIGYATVVIADGSSATLQDVSVGGMVHGIIAHDGRLRVADSSISAQQWGIAGVRKAVLDTVTIAVSDPGGYCVGATAESRSAVVGSDVTLSSCVDGIWASRRVRLTRLTATNNTGIGVFSGSRLVLVSSTVTGSGVLDLLSVRRPALTDTSCDRSGVAIDDIPTTSWGVCAND
jgi:hypothetical protein